MNVLLGQSNKIKHVNYVLPYHWIHVNQKLKRFFPSTNVNFEAHETTAHIESCEPYLCKNSPYYPAEGVTLHFVWLFTSSLIPKLKRRFLWKKGVRHPITKYFRLFEEYFWVITFLWQEKRIRIFLLFPQINISQHSSHYIFYFPYNYKGLQNFSLYRSYYW